MKTRLISLLLALLLASISTSAHAGDYVIGEGDGLEVAVWGVKELTFPVRVRPDGKITIPGLGDVAASGLTPAALQTSLTSKLKELVKNPIVTVTVSQITNSKVYIFGGGVKSGVFELHQRSTLLQLLCTLGELKSADLTRSYVLRKGKKVKEGFHKLFINGDTSEDIALESGDSLFLPVMLDKSVYILGAVNAPKSIEYREGLKVLEAILEAGGFTKYADQNDVVIRRKEGGEGVQLEVKAKKLMKDGDLTQNMPLKPGDYVVVRESLF